MTRLLYPLPPQIASAQGNKTLSGQHCKMQLARLHFTVLKQRKVAAIYLPRLFCLSVTKKIPCLLTTESQKNCSNHTLLISGPLALSLVCLSMLAPIYRRVNMKKLALFWKNALVKFILKRRKLDLRD